MKQLLIRPEIWEFSDFHTFAEAFAVGADDLILTNEYIYRPVIETERLKSSVIFQEKYGQENRQMRWHRRFWKKCKKRLQPYHCDRRRYDH